MGPCPGDVCYAQSLQSMSDSWRSHGLCSPPNSSVYGIIQARILGWVAIFYYRGSSQRRNWTLHLLHLLHWQADSLPLCHLESPHTTLGFGQEAKKEEGTIKLPGVLCRDALTSKKLKHKQGHQNAPRAASEASLRNSIKAGVKIHSFIQCI